MEHQSAQDRSISLRSEGTEEQMQPFAPLVHPNAIHTIGILRPERFPQPATRLGWPDLDHATDVKRDATVSPQPGRQCGKVVVAWPPVHLASPRERLVEPAGVEVGQVDLFRSGLGIPCWQFRSIQWQLDDLCLGPRRPSAGPRSAFSRARQYLFA